MSVLTVGGLRYKIYGNAEQENDRGLYYMGNTFKKCLAAGAAALAAWALLIRPRTKYSPDLSALAAYDFANGGLHDFYKGIAKNSLPAVKAAMDGGYAVKLDVRVSRDGVPVILSEHDLYGLCGVDGEAENMALAELKKLKLQETDETVCTLEEMLAEIDCRVPVILELMVYRDNYGTLCRRVTDVLEKYEGVYAIESVDYRAVRWFKKYEPDVLRGQTLERASYAGKDLLSALVCFAGNMMFTNILSSPDYISAGYSERKNISLKYCKLLYHVPVVCRDIKTAEQYEAARSDDEIAVFENMEPGD